MLTTRGEDCLIKVFKRKENSPYEWEDTPYIVFFGKPANQLEKKKYRIQKGVNGSTDSVFIFASNLETPPNISDKVDFMGKQWTVESTGYYFDSSRIVNYRYLSEEQIIEKCPKGIALH